ncbi:MAG: SDR family oxidoreductase, partial [Pseudomonadota bacterium]
CQAAVETVLSAWGRIDILVNNAGIVEPNGVMDVAPEDYDRVTDVNLRGTLYMSQAVIPTMRKQGEGSIVNVSSVAGQRGGGVFGGAHYAAAKAGVLGLSKAMARELAPDNVRVNAVCPGYIDTDIVVGRLSEDRRAKIIEGIPMGRPGDAVDVAGVCVFLGCSLSAYVTGAVLDVNGGSHIH